MYFIHYTCIHKIHVALLCSRVTEIEQSQIDLCNNNIFNFIYLPAATIPTHKNKNKNTFIYGSSGWMQNWKSSCALNELVKSGKTKKNGKRLLFNCRFFAENYSIIALNGNIKCKNWISEMCVPDFCFGLQFTLYTCYGGQTKGLCIWADKMDRNFWCVFGT